MSLSTERYEKLLQKYLDGQCNRAEMEELYAWLQSSGSNRSLLAAMQREFEKTMGEHYEIPSELSDRIETRLLQDISQEKVIRFPQRMRLRWIAAAAVVLLAGSGVYYYMNTVSSRKALTANTGVLAADTGDIAPGTNKAILTLANGDVVTLDSAGNQIINQGETVVRQQNGQLHYAGQGSSDVVTYNTLTVPRGGQFNIVLSDGSHVWLNAASSMRYPTSFNGDRREVEIQGQGYFEVAPNASKPFFVKANNTEVQVLGTQFDIMAYADEKSINTTLIEGLVNVKYGNTEQRLKPGQQAVVDPATGVMVVMKADVDQVIAWKTGFFEFDNATMADILRQLARWYDIEVSYNQTGNERLFGGRISRSLPLSDILHMLEANGPTFSLSGRKLTVTSGK
ncbi:FecR domain-containing protein [Chitinophaga pinensis]|uniref:Anti-FecI sigma factor, FecR n=1 Tax=Chitinophaga pinensis (strain ATCC 43595 / DSM 2588 / LMG 13176 / NBRC 15968 / NCIMB 11800 / UQM 2034) TaxID=485918 RepID=A0A979GBF4_CHIPD|nr:FecR domain-containing protein [Chitinophaga pinensis]ACU64142.1 anti-FecI sigma factor, FecR [Chitinophaga pinensis DSM 2588]